MSGKPGRKEAAGAPKSRQDRLKSALKENLKRRKAQARARGARAEKKD